MDTKDKLSCVNIKKVKKRLCQKSNKIKHSNYTLNHITTLMVKRTNKDSKEFRGVRIYFNA